MSEKPRDIYAMRAYEWASQVNKATGNTYFDELAARAEAAYYDPSKQTIMRNQIHMGFDNNMWPALSRMLIMGNPKLIAKIHPRESEVDSPQGSEMLARLYRKLTGHVPRVEDWRDAK